MPSYTEETFLKAISGSAGIKTVIAKKIGCTRVTLDKWISENENVKACYQEENEKVLDLAESALISEIKTGNTVAILFYLKCKGKKRGYVEKTEVTHGLDDSLQGFSVSIKRNRESSPKADDTQL